jgi:hypothetical protein
VRTVESIVKNLGEIEAKMNQLFRTRLVSKQGTAEIALAVVSLHLEASELTEARRNPQRKKALRRFFQHKRVLEKTLSQLNGQKGGQK